MTDTNDESQEIKTPPQDKTSKKISEYVLEGLAKNRRFKFLLVGRTGVGKSSTINRLIGKEVATVNDFEPETVEVKEYNSDIDGVPFTVVDTPGLADDLDEFRKDQKYLDSIRSQVKKIDCLFFVTRLDDTRVSRDEKQAIKVISEELEPNEGASSIWENSVIVFTFANNVQSSKYSNTLEKRTKLIQKETTMNYVGQAWARSVLKPH